jgi:anaerobic selenocysteine-containing dehydrogenase
MLTGAAGGALCPSGLCAHHLPFAPRPAAIDLDAAVTEAAAALNRDGEGYAAILDLRPGRTASLLYRSTAAKWSKGAYLTAPAVEGATSAAVERLAGHPVGLDLENTRTLLSFSTPVLDGWGSPGRVMGRKAAGLRVIQVDSLHSVTAALADQWIPVQPGAEAALARILAGILADGKVDDARIERLGLLPQTVRSLAETLAAGGPAVAIADGSPGSGPLGGEAQEAVARLNAALGSIGVPGGFVPRRETPAPSEWSSGLAPLGLGDLPDQSIRWLFIDESGADASIPWSAVQRKLRSGAYVIAVSSSPEGIGRHAAAMIPAAAFPEAFDDAPVSVDSPAASFRVSAPLYDAPARAAVPLELLGRITGEQCSIASALESRAGAVLASHRGRIFDYASGEHRELPAEDFWKTLTGGASWQDDPLPAPASRKSRELSATASEPSPPFSAQTSHAEFPLLLAAVGWRGASGSPLMRKLDQESDLRQARHVARLHPETAARYGLADEADAQVETPCGSCRMRVRTDASVPPETLEVAGAQRMLDLCDTNGDCSWRAARARIQSA